MVYNVDYTDHKVLIRDGITGESIAKTKILEYNKNRYSILVDASNFVERLLHQPRLSLLIFTKDSIHVFGGVARRSFNPRHMEISMFQGKEHDDRGAKRYPANIDAVVSNVASPEGEQVSNEAFAVKVLDVSTHGVQIFTEHETLEVDFRFVLRLEIEGSPTCLHCVIVRSMEDEQNGHKTYGCKFISVESV